jgi:hypothetical protein
MIIAGDTHIMLLCCMQGGDFEWETFIQMTIADDSHMMLLYCMQGGDCGP